MTDEPTIQPAEEPRTPDVMIGVGDLNPEAYRFNWGAFLMPGLWGLVYGVWQFVGLELLAILVPITVASLMSGDAAVMPLSAMIAATVVSEAFVGVARLWAGMNANRLLWRREQIRLTLVPNAKPKHPLPRYLRRQRTWTIVGAILVAPAIAIQAPQVYKEWQAFGMGTFAVAEPFIWLFAEMSLGAWLAYRMTVDGPDGPQPANDVI